MFIWSDFICCFSVDKFYHETYLRDFRVTIESDGTVTWNYGGNFVTSCTLDMTYYPFDTQQCSMEFENWAYSGPNVLLGASSDDLIITDGASNGLWNIDSSRIDVRYETKGENEVFASVLITLNLARKSHYYVLNIVAPGILLIMLTLAGFWLPADSGEKVGLGITVLLSFAVFLLVVMDQTPKDSDHTPLLCKFVTKWYLFTT